MKLKLKKLIRLKDLPKGSLFLHEGTLALKTEYTTKGSPDAYIVGSGEYYWGGSDDREVRDETVVVQVKVKNK